MKKLEALMSPESIELVTESLEDHQISNFMFVNVVAKSPHCARRQVYRGQTYAVELDPEVKLEAVVRDDQATDAAYAVLKAAGGPGTSCKPRVVLTPVNEVIFELDDFVAQANFPTIRASQAIETAVAAAARVASSPDHQPIWRPLFSAFAKMRGFLARYIPEDPPNEPLPLASRSVADRRWRRAWLPSLRPAHR